MPGSVQVIVSVAESSVMTTVGLVSSVTTIPQQDPPAQLELPTSVVKV